MSTESPKAEEGRTGESQELSSTDLQDLEQHISQRISRLTDLTGQAENSLYQLDPDQLAPIDASLIPPFESFDGFDVPAMNAAEQGFRSAYHDLSTSINRNAEVLQSIHDLNDLLTDSIRQLNIRMAALEERMAVLTETAEHEFKKHSKELKVISRESAQGGAKGRETAPDRVSGEQTAGILSSLQKELIELESRIDRFGSEIRRDIDQQQTAAHQTLDARLRTNTGMPEETREHLNRVTFNLAILLIIVLFIGGALVATTLDRMTNYMTESIDSLRNSVDQLTPANPPGNPGGSR